MAFPFFAPSLLKRLGGVEPKNQRAPLANKIGKDGNHLFSWPD